MNVARAVTPSAATAGIERDPDLIARYLEDAAHYPGGHAIAITRPHDVAEAAAAVRQASRLLPVGAQSSLTGGATPFGDLVLSTERLSGITAHRIACASAPASRCRTSGRARGRSRVASAGADVSRRLCRRRGGDVRRRRRHLQVRPDTGVGGGAHHRAAGGDVLDVSRGDVLASDDGDFVVQTSAGERTIHVPDLRMPDVPKRSAGYHSAPDMDLVDLFIGSEGTLGVIVEAELQDSAAAGRHVLRSCPAASEAAAIALTASFAPRRSRPGAPAIRAASICRAIEHIDRAIDRRHPRGRRRSQARYHAAVDGCRWRC